METYNSIHKAILKICEEKQSEGSYTGDVNKLSEELTRAACVELLSDQQRRIYNVLGDNYQSTKEIVRRTGIQSKNISSTLLQMLVNTGLISMKSRGRLKYWARS